MTRRQPCGVYAPLRENGFGYILYTYFIFIMSFIFSIFTFLQKVTLPTTNEPPKAPPLYPKSH
ncbi:hypothetical protein SB861_58715, partial [Paraburkholderia sp. SIMBA_049]